MTNTIFFNIYFNEIPHGIREKTPKDIECAFHADDLILWTAPRKHIDKIVISINQILKALH